MGFCLFLQGECRQHSASIWELHDDENSVSYAVFDIVSVHDFKFYLTLFYLHFLVSLPCDNSLTLFTAQILPIGECFVCTTANYDLLSDRVLILLCLSCLSYSSSPPLFVSLLPSYPNVSSDGTTSLFLGPESQSHYLYSNFPCKCNQQEAKILIHAVKINLVKARLCFQ